MEIEVVIETLVVEGVEVGDPSALQAAVAAELNHLLATEGPPALWRQRASVPVVDAGVITPTSSGALGADIARAVHGGNVS